MAPLWGVPGWEDDGVDCQLHVLPESDYRPLIELNVGAARELSAVDFLATEEDVASVREATIRQNQNDAGE
jgi:hypothetical protein